MANLVFIPATSGPANQELTLDEIPADIQKDVDDAYTLLKTNPGRFKLVFPSEGEANAWINMVKAYCKVRPGGEIRFRKSPIKGLPAGTIEFRITDLLTKDEEITEGIRTATEAVKAAGGAK